MTSVVARDRQIAAGFRAATVSGALQASVVGLSSTTTGPERTFPATASTPLR